MGQFSTTGVHSLSVTTVLGFCQFKYSYSAATSMVSGVERLTGLISWSRPSYHCLNVFIVSHLKKVVDGQHREKEGPRIYCSAHLFDLLPTDSLADYKHRLGHFKNSLNNSELSSNPKQAHPDSSEPEDRPALLYKTSISWSLAIFLFRTEGKRVADVPAKGLSAESWTASYSKEKGTTKLDHHDPTGVYRIFKFLEFWIMLQLPQILALGKVSEI